MITPDRHNPVDLARAAYRQAVLRAREDPYAFALFIGNTDTGQPIRRASIHEEWHRFLSANRYAVLYAPVGHAKTTQISVWRVVWEIGKNPNLRVAIISSAKSAMPAKILAGIKREIMSNRRVRDVFPHLRPAVRFADPQARWSDSAITVERDPTVAIQDPTVQTFGAPGEILGSRLDLVIIDDIHSQENVLTELQRDKIWDFVAGPVLTRGPPQGGRVWAVGHVWHKDDALARLSRLPGYASSPKYSAFTMGDDGVEAPLIPEMWGIEELRRRESTLRPVLAKLMLRNILMAPEDQRIREEWITTCLRNGVGITLVDQWNPADAPTFTGVDLAAPRPGQPRAGALASAFTIAILPDGTRRILDLRSGRWSAPDTLRHLVDIQQRYGSIITVENNGAQDFLHQFSDELTALSLRRHHTGMNKWDLQFGVDSIGTELERGKWQIPCDQNLEPAPEVAAWIQELLAYTPQDHTGDRVMASWIAREAARVSGYGFGTTLEPLPDADQLWRAAGY